MASVVVDCPSASGDDRQKVTLKNFNIKQKVGDFITDFCKQQKYTGEGWSLFFGRIQLPIDGTFEEFEVKDGSELEMIQMDDIDDDLELEAALAN